MTELDKLEAYLEGRQIAYECVALPDGAQIIAYDDDWRRVWDAMCTAHSYGGRHGLLEIMGKIVDRKKDGDNVVGWLTAEDVINRLEGLR